VQHKELVVGKDDEGEEQHQEEGGLPPPISQGLSCADIAMRDEQGLTINQAIAAVAADYLVRLLLTNNLERFQTYIDLNSGSMQSTTITPVSVGKWRRGRVS
jgi:hypothetical protein